MIRNVTGFRKATGRLGKRKGRGGDCRLSRLRWRAGFDGLENRLMLSGGVPISFIPAAPAGSGIYDQTLSSQFTLPDQTNSFVVTLDAEETLSLRVVPQAISLQTQFTLTDPNNQLVATVAAPAAGASAYLENWSIATAGQYQIDVSNTSGEGAFALTAALGASFDQTASHTLGSAKDITPAFQAVNGSATASVAGVVGTAPAPGSTPAPDYYSFALDEGDRVTLAAASASGDMSGLDLLDSSGNLLALGLVSSFGTDIRISDFVAPAAGTYVVEVVGSSLGGYNVAVARNASLALPTNSVATTPQNLDATGLALGSLGTASIVEESEPNDLISTANDLAGNFVQTDTNTYVAHAQGDIAPAYDGDFFAFPASPGDQLTIQQIGSQDFSGNPTGNTLPDTYLYLYDQSGNLLTWDDDSYGTLNSTIDYTVPSDGYTGDYYIRAAAYSSNTGTYDLYVTSVTTSPQSLLPTPADFYAIDANAGDVLTFGTTTPGDGPNDPPNTLDPALVLYDPDGDVAAMDDNGGGDGRNALISYTAAASGTYLVMVSNVSGAGAYVLSTGGSSASQSDAGPTVAATIPLDGQSINYSPAALDVTYSEPVRADLIDPAQLTIDGGATVTSAELIGGSTVRYDLSLPQTQTTFDYMLGAGAVVDYNGVASQAFSGSFTVDTTGPYVVSQSPASTDNLAAPLASIAFTFDEPIDPGTATTASIDRFTDPNGNDLSSQIIAVEVAGSTLTVDFVGQGLLGTYTMTIGPGITDLAGNPIDQNKNGINGEPGDTYTAQATITSSPDLVASEVSGPASSENGDIIPVSWTVTNQGSGDATGDWYDRVWFSLTPVFDPSTAYWAADFPEAFPPGNSLSAGASYQENENVQVPGNLPAGTWYLVVETNGYNDLAESDETNNVAAATQTIDVATPNVNLIVTNVSAPVSANPGDTIEVSWTVANNGSEPTTANSWTDEVLISTVDYLDSSAIPLVWVTHDQGGPSTPLDPGATYTDDLDITLPGFLPQSPMYLLFNINQDSSSTYDFQAETDYTNNVVPQAIAVNQSDLVVSTASAPASVTPDTSFPVSWTVTNQGAAATQSNGMVRTQSITPLPECSTARKSTLGRSTNSKGRWRRAPATARTSPSTCLPMWPAGPVI